MKSFAIGGLVIALSVAPASAAPMTNKIDDAATAAASAAAAADRPPVEPARGHPAIVSHDDHVRATHAYPVQVTHDYPVQMSHDDHVLTYDYRTTDGRDVTYQGRWTGTWTGHYEGQPTTIYNGSYDGRYDGNAANGKRRHHAHRDYNDRYAYSYPPVYGYGWGAPVMTTITFQSAPVVTTTTTTTEEVIYGAAPRKRIARRYWKPRPKLRCAC